MRAYDWQKENVFQQKNIILISSLQKISAPHFSTTSFLMIFVLFLLKKRKKTYHIKTMQLRSGLGLFNREMFLLLRNNVYIYKSVYVKRMCITEIMFLDSFNSDLRNAFDWQRFRLFFKYLELSF